MTQIANYYAVAGLQIEQGSIKRLDRYLSQVRGRFTNLQKSLSSSANIQVTARLNVQRTSSLLNRSLRQSARGLQLDLNDVQINRANLNRRIQESLGGLGKTSPIEIDAKLSETSIAHIKNQVTQALNSITVTPTVNAKVKTSGGEGRATRSRAVEGTKEAARSVGYFYTLREDKSTAAASSSMRGRVAAYSQAIMLAAHNRGIVSGNYLTRFMGEGPRQFISRREVAANDSSIRGRRGVVGFSGDATGGGRSWGGGRRPGEGWDKTRRVSPHSRRNFNPWYNPMLVGGGLGAFMRYGVYSLPFVAGSFGASSMVSRTSELQNARAVMDVALRGGEAGGQHYDFLTQLGLRLGFRPEDVARPYSKWVNSARGTSFESHIPQSFRSLMEYSATRRLDGSSLADFMSRIISSGRVRSSDLDALTTSGMDIAWQAMADAISGGDREALREVLKSGGVNAEEALPKFFAVLRRESRDYLDDVYTSIDRNRNKAAAQSSKWFEAMMGGELEESLSRFYSVIAQITGESEGGAAAVGKVLATAADSLSVAMLTSKEVVDYLKKQEKEGNFLTAWFGSAEDNKRLKEYTESIKRLGDAYSMIFDLYKKIRSSEDAMTFLRIVTIGPRMALKGYSTASKVYGTAASVLTGNYSYFRGLEEARKEGTEAEFRERYPSPSDFYRERENMSSSVASQASLQNRPMVNGTSGNISSLASLTDSRSISQVPLRLEVSGSIDLGDLGTIGDDPETRDRLRLITTEVLMDAMMGANRQSPKNVIN